MIQLYRCNVCTCWKLQPKANTVNSFLNLFFFFVAAEICLLIQFFSNFFLHVQKTFLPFKNLQFSKVNTITKYMPVLVMCSTVISMIYWWICWQKKVSTMNSQLNSVNWPHNMNNHCLSIYCKKQKNSSNEVPNMQDHLLFNFFLFKKKKIISFIAGHTNHRSRNYSKKKIAKRRFLAHLSFF